MGLLCKLLYYLLELYFYQSYQTENNIKIGCHKFFNAENYFAFQETQESDVYEHVKDASSHHDKQTLDAATADQQQQQDVANVDEQEAEEMDGDEDIKADDSDQREVDSL